MQTQIDELSQLLDAAANIEPPQVGSEYDKYLKRKTGWSPAQYQDTYFKPTGAQTHVCLQKAMCLALELEVPVGLFTLAASKREFTSDQRYALLDNSKDELVHYEALSNWANAGAEIPKKYQLEASWFSTAIKDLREHELVKSGYIELGIFFVVLSIFRKFGSPSIKLLAADISTDEATHVLTNWAIIDANQIPWAASKLNSLRADIIHWLTKDIISTSYGYQFWEDQSQRLIATRQAEGLAFTKTGMHTAFFEIPNSSLAAY